MRNLFLLLLVANLLFFGWRYFVDRPEVPGIERIALNEVTVEQVVPAPGVPDAPDEGADVAPPGGEDAVAAAVATPVGPQCVSIGPFRDVADADTESAALATQGLAATRRSAAGQVFEGHWVYVANLPNRAASRTMLRTLQDGGIRDAYPIAAETPGQYVISLGIFSEADRAERVELSAKSLGAEVVVEPRYKDAPVFWLDVALAAGEGTEGLVAAYGDSLLRLGEDANCPP